MLMTIYHQLIAELNSGLDIQTGMLLYTKGSAPQIPGALAVFNKEKVVHGTLGGGLLEVQAQKTAANASVNQMNTMQWIHFNAEMDDQEGAICGGSALFAIDANPKQHLDVYRQMVESLDRHKCGALFTFFRKQKDQNLVIERIWVEQNSKLSEDIEIVIKTEQVNLQDILDNRKPYWIESVQHADENPAIQTSLFIESIHPVPQLIIVGAGHIGQALCRAGNLVDFEVIVLDNRMEMATISRFPEASQVICKSLAEGFKSIFLSSDSYIVIATQGHRTDVEALRCCIRSNAAYIGVIGSKRKTLLMGQKFIAEGWATESEWKFIHAPVGLDIHSKSVNEIAISIIAELIKERYELNYLRKRKKVSCIVLAAGKSTRMGKQKLLLPYNGKTIIKSIVEKTLNSDSSQTVVVIGSYKKEVKAELADCAVHLVENEKFEEGMLSSVQAGVAAVNCESDGMLILLGDQPMITISGINLLIAAFQKTQKGLIIPTFHGKRGHPVLISSKYKQRINSLNPELGLRELFTENSQDILEIEVNTDDVLKDIDTPEDYLRETFIVCK